MEGIERCAAQDYQYAKEMDTYDEPIAGGEYQDGGKSIGSKCVGAVSLSRSEPLDAQHLVFSVVTQAQHDQNASFFGSELKLGQY